MTKNYSVAIGFHGEVSRHNFFLCCDKVWPRHEILGHGRVAT